MESYSKNVFARLDFSKARSIDALTAAASTFLPLENFTLSLIVNVHVLWSGDTSHLEAIHGCGFICSSNLANVSPTP